MPGPAARKPARAVRPPPRVAPRSIGPAIIRVPSTSLTMVTGPAIKLSYNKAAKDPRFKTVIDKLQKSSAKTKQHPSASQKSAQAQAAALPPANEKLAGAKATQVGTMKEAETGKPDQSSFLEMLRAAIEKAIPKKTEGAKDFMKGDDKQQLKDAMTGNIGAQKDEATSGIKSASEHPPDPSQIQGKEVTPIPGEPAPVAPPIGAAGAMPAPRQDSEVSLDRGKQDADKAVKDAGLTEGQLNEANDPRFSRIVTAKQQVDTQAQSLPQKYRADEKSAIAGAEARAVGDEKKGLAGSLTAKQRAGVAVKARQLTAKEKDELRRKEVAKNIESIYERTRAAVDRKLENLETEVGAVFDAGTEAALKKMRDYVDERFDDRYSGISGKVLWLKDKLVTLPPSVKAWFDESRKVFIEELDRLVVRVASLVELRLKQAKDLIANGEKEISNYVVSLPEDLKAVGKAAQKEMADRFQDMRQSVDDKKQDLAQNLGQRYKEATEKGDKALKEMKDAHKSLVEKLKEFVGEVIEVLRNFKNRLMGMLKKGKDAIGLIVAHPIKFLGNLLSALGKGIGQFVDHIEDHLREGFLKWLFGSLGGSGITMPKDLSLGSILMLVLQVLGLTYDKLRAKAVKLIGERNVAVIEKVFGFLKTLWAKGPAALWEEVKEFLSDLKEQVIDSIREWLIATIIKKATIKLVSMFNPVGAIIQAILMIYDTAMFFIENINRILDFVEAVINSFYKIATGAIDDAANWIEKALANTIPIIIAFLARLLGISGITDKIVSTIKKIQTRVDRAVDKVIAKIVSGIKKLVGAGKAAVAGVFQWWTVKKPFTGADGKPHTISVDRQDKHPVVMVRSTEQPLTEVIKVQPQPNRDKLTAKYAEIEKLFGSAEPDEGEQKQQERHSKVQKVIDEIAKELGQNDVRPTVVTHAEASGGRAFRVIADPLTKQPGNTKGSPSQGGIQYKDLVSALLKPGSKGFMMFSSSHLLAERLNGPAVGWNLANTGKGLNKAMEKPERKAEGWKNKDGEVKYVTHIEYYDQQFPPTDRTALAAGTPEQKLKWLRGLVAQKYTVNVSLLKPLPGDVTKPGDVSSFTCVDPPNFLDRLELIGGEIPPTTAKLVLDAAKETMESTPTGNRVPGIVFLARRLGIGTDAASRALEQLAKEGSLERRADNRYYFRT